MQQTAKKTADFREVQNNPAFNAGNGLVTLALNTDTRLLVPAVIDLGDFLTQDDTDALYLPLAFESTVNTSLALKAPLASPVFSGNPTAPTQTAGNNSTRLATTAFVGTALANALDALINSAPGTLDTLGEIAAQLANDQSAVAAITITLAGKEPSIAAGTTAQYWRGDKSWQTLDKSAVGLGNVANVDALPKTGGTLTGALIGTSATFSGLITANSGGASLKAGGLTGSESTYAGIWINQATPSASNYAFLSGAGDTFFNCPSNGKVRFRNANADLMTVGVQSSAYQIETLYQSRFSHTGHASDASAGAAILIKASADNLPQNDAVRIEPFNSATARARWDKDGKIFLPPSSTGGASSSLNFGPTADQNCIGWDNVYGSVSIRYGNTTSLRVHNTSIGLPSNSALQWHTGAMPLTGVDVNLYRGAADILATDDDFELKASAKGVILTDRTNGNRYRLKMDAGVLGVELV